MFQHTSAKGGGLFADLRPGPDPVGSGLLLARHPDPAAGEPS